ncbi:hypothetical protein [Rhizobium leguminosarum]|uniref:hypothetical protein n=1 Tax=Rhizobium leguminosarum TaxID=384 RepID=UPI003F962FC7
MAAPHLAPDVRPNSEYTADNQCVAHAMDVAGQYAAQVHFLGVIAGVYGAEQQREAVEKIKAAVSDLIKETSGVLNKINNMANDAALGWGGGLLDNYFAVGEWFERNLMFDGDAMADETAKLRAEHLSEAKRAEARKRFLRDWNTLKDQIVGYAKKTYDEIKQLCLNGQWKVALCKFGIDLAFAVLESAVIAAVAAVTAGAGAVAARVGLTAIKRGEKFAVSLIRKDRPGKAFELGDVKNSDLSEAERRILGSDNQGSTVPDPKQGPAEVADDAAAKKAKQQQSGKEARTNGQDGENFYKDTRGGRALQNDSGNGIDNIKDDPLTFNEIKTSTRGDYSMYGEELLGGEHFVKSRLDAMRRGAKPYQKMSKEDRTYAGSLLKRLNAGEPATYNKVKLKKTDDGRIVEDGVEPWKRDDKAFKAWRDKKEKKRTRRAERRAAEKAAETPPSTGPPASTQ